MEFHPKVLEEKTKKAVKLLENSDFLKKFYLAGGTAAALYLGHRISNDLDFFSKEEFNESALVQKVSKLGKFELDKKTEQTVLGNLNGVKVSFLGYYYPLVHPLKKFGNMYVASLADIACMKLDTIGSRGAKRDFIDLYFIVKEIMPLSRIFKFFQKKYLSINYNPVHIKKGLVYFKDADKEPEPLMLKPAKWKSVKSFFESEIINSKF